MDQYLVDDKILASPLIHKCVILIRSPEGALRSLMDRYGFGEEVAGNIYANRLKTLARYGETLRGRAILIEYEQILEGTDATLAVLTQFFNTARPFTPNYTTHKATGKMGDPSLNIFSGRVIRTPGHHVNVNPEVMLKATQAFHEQRCRLWNAGVAVVCKPENRNLLSE
jgi:hypothetical protein